LNHNLLSVCLLNAGFRDKALLWLEEYLTARSFSVHIGESSSPPSSFEYGVPQGSVLGPLLFTMYVRTIGQIISQHSVKYVIYADDIQLFISAHPSSINSIFNQLEKCINDLQLWLSSKQLIMNPNKTELILLGRNKDLAALSPALELTVCNVKIKPKSNIRDLGFMLDSNLSMEAQITAACRTSLYYLRAISRQRIFLSKQCAERLVHAFVFSRLYYCPSLLHIINKKLECKVQRVVNYAMRVVEMLPRASPVAPYFLTRKWLLIHQQIHQRAAIIVYTALRYGEPYQIASLLKLNNAESQTSLTTRRSADATLLKTIHGRTKVGDSAFSAASTKLWNALPRTVRESKSLSTFRNNLRDYLLSSS
jgi:hypothetical protein